MRLLPLDDHAWADPRGWGLRPLGAAGLPADALGDVHVVSVEPGAVRGNHRHPDVREWLLVFGAPATLASRTADGPVRTVAHGGPRPTLAVFEPGEDHAVRCDGPGTLYLVSWADGVPTTERVDPLL